MIRLRATAALTAALLLPLAACATPDDGPTAARATTSAKPATKEDREAPTRGLEDDSGVGDVADTSTPARGTTDQGDLPTPGPVDPALGPGHNVSQTEFPAAESELARADPSQAGAEWTATFFTAAWSDALQTGDGTPVRSLALDTCTFCASVADTAEGTPLGPDLHLVTTIWPIMSMPPSDEYPNTTVVAGIEFLVVRPSANGDVVTTEILTQRHHLLRIGVAWVDGRWAVHGVDADPWDGSDPRTA